MSVRELEHLADAVRSELDGDAPERAHAEGKERMMDAISRELALPRRRRRATIGWLAAACLACVACLALYLAWPVARLTFEVRGGDVARIDAAGARISASASAAIARFSDGSTVTFAPGSSGRIEEVGARGARVILSDGSVHLDVVHRAETSWSVEAGPHVVRVTGTEFDVTWSPESGRFAVRMLRGSVRIEGPSAPNGVALEAGYVLEADWDGALTVRRDTPVREAATSAPEAPSSSVAMVASPSASTATSAPTVAQIAPQPGARVAPAPKSESWSELVSSGHYDLVVQAARARGISDVADTAPLADLTALADAARYERDAVVARAVLEAERKRFPESEAGRTATFLLGRLAEDSGGDVARAIALYDEYLASGGPFAVEALGRKMAAIQRSQGDAAARPVAAQYLALHPNGPHAELARSIVGSP